MLTLVYGVAATTLVLVYALPLAQDSHNFEVMRAIDTSAHPCYAPFITNPQPLTTRQPTN